MRLLGTALLCNVAASPAAGIKPNEIRRLDALDESSTRSFFERVFENRTHA